MIVSAALLSIREIFSPPLRAVLWKSLALTVALLALVGVILAKLFDWWLSGHSAVADHPWIETYSVLLAGVGLIVGSIYLIPAVSMLVAGFFLDDVAETVETSAYPQDVPGRAMPLGPSLLASARFALTMLGVNLLALVFLFIPGVNLVAFFAANAYLLGQEYFLLAAGRHLPQPEARALRSRHAGTVLLGGALIALIVLTPIVNLLTPLFGATLMVHVFKRLPRAVPAPERA